MFKKVKMKVKEVKTKHFVWYDGCIQVLRNEYRIYESTEEHIKRMIKRGYWAEDLCPLKCHKCGGSAFESRNIDTLDSLGSVVLEYEEYCKKCDTSVRYWAHGSWMP